MFKIGNIVHSSKTACLEISKNYLLQFVTKKENGRLGIIISDNIAVSGRKCGVVVGSIFGQQGQD
jgi:hypothetical protein